MITQELLHFLGENLTAEGWGFRGHASGVMVSLYFGDASRGTSFDQSIIYLRQPAEMKFSHPFLFTVADLKMPFLEYLRTDYSQIRDGSSW
jgi:hypothetical protein